MAALRGGAHHGGTFKPIQKGARKPAPPKSFPAPPVPKPAPATCGGGTDTGETPSVGTAGVGVVGANAVNQMGDVEKFARANRGLMDSLKRKRTGDLWPD
jgi:hypothetical protein